MSRCVISLSARAGSTNVRLGLPVALGEVVRLVGAQQVSKMSVAAAAVEKVPHMGSGMVKCRSLRCRVHPPARLTLNRRCSAIADTDGLHHCSWYKGDLHELTCLGSGHASPHCASWQNRMILIAPSRLRDTSMNI